MYVYMYIYIYTSVNECMTRINTISPGFIIYIYIYSRYTFKWSLDWFKGNIKTRNLFDWH